MILLNWSSLCHLGSLSISFFWIHKQRRESLCWLGCWSCLPSGWLLQKASRQERVWNMIIEGVLVLSRMWLMSMENYKQFNLGRKTKGPDPSGMRFGSLHQTRTHDKRECLGREYKMSPDCSQMVQKKWHKNMCVYLCACVWETGEREKREREQWGKTNNSWVWVNGIYMKVPCTNLEIFLQIWY